jgi:hypothetical protein
VPSQNKEHFPFHHFSNRIYIWYFKMLKQVECGLTHISEQNSNILPRYPKYIIIIIMVVVVVIIIISIIIITSARSHKQTLTNSQQISFIFLQDQKQKKKVPRFEDRAEPGDFPRTGELLHREGAVLPEDQGRARRGGKTNRPRGAVIYYLMYLIDYLLLLLLPQFVL